MVVTPTASRPAALHRTDCTLCPHRCGTLRATASGVCGVGRDSYIASEMLHHGEERLLHPAHAIFFSGCTASCSFCIAARFAFRPTYGVRVSPGQLATRILQRQDQGARSLCFIGGEPTPHIPFILETLACLGAQRRIPAVFNTNLYLTPQALDLLEDAIDIYLPDLKFGPGTCGDELGAMPDYWRVVGAALERLLRRGRRTIVRHLLMPGHFECCTEPVLRRLAGRPGLEVSLLSQYLPPAHARGELARPLTGDQIEQAATLARSLGLRLVP